MGTPALRGQKHAARRGLGLQPPRARCHLAVCVPQNLYSQTSEALDQMLQTFITQNPTAEELHFLLSVRGGGGGAGHRQGWSEGEPRRMSQRRPGGG